MSERKLLSRIICVLICAALLITDATVFAAVLPFETQYDYDEADIAWLTDLVIKEDMKTIEGLSQRVTLVPQPEYPYTETPESFEEEVNYFVSLYNLETGSQRVAYIYFFEVLNANSGAFSADVSDEEVREYLEGMGIAYPDRPDSDELVMARALFTAFITGAAGTSTLPLGSDLESAIVSYLADITGMNMATLRQCMPDGSVLSLDEYILAASKLALWTNGYDVSKDTPEEEVFRLVALMTVRAQGISVASDVSEKMLKVQYISALLGAKYSVTMDVSKLDIHLKNKTTAFYILQLMGKEGGLSIREENATYEEAFELVAEYTDRFDVENDDFYADITEYSAQLATRCESLWVYPTAYATNTAYNCLVTVNGKSVKNNYYNEVFIDPDLKEQDLVIVVTASGGGVSSKCTYTIHITQGTYENVEGDKPVTDTNDSYTSADSLVTGILASIGANSLLSSILDTSYTTIPVGLSGIVSFIAPTFESTGTISVSDSTDTGNDSFYISVLDEIGAIADAEIDGIPGLSLLGNLAYGEDSFVTFG